ncbi:MAG: hypothetical protein AAGG48_16730 [Planctomycetota bacterium]
MFFTQKLSPKHTGLVFLIPLLTATTVAAQEVVSSHDPVVVHAHGYHAGGCQGDGYSQLGDGACYDNRSIDAWARFHGWIFRRYAGSVEMETKTEYPKDYFGRFTYRVWRPDWVRNPFRYRSHPIAPPYRVDARPAPMVTNPSGPVMVESLGDQPSPNEVNQAQPLSDVGVEPIFVEPR